MTPEEFAYEATQVYTLLMQYAEKERESEGLSLIPELTQAQLLPVISAAVAKYVDDCIQDAMLAVSMHIEERVSMHIEERVAAGIAAHEARRGHSIHVG